MDALSPARRWGSVSLLAGVNPKNLILTAGLGGRPGPARALDDGRRRGHRVFVVIASLTIAGPVVYSARRRRRAKATLDSAKAWLTAHNAAVMAVLFLVFGVDLIAKGLPPLTS